MTVRQHAKRANAHSSTFVFADSQSQNKKPKELTISQFKAVANKYREVLPVYIKDYINLERFAA